MNYRIRPQTRYQYSEPTAVSYNEVRLSPRTLAAQILISKTIAVDPMPTERRERVDYFGNPIWVFSINQPHTALTVTVESHVRIQNHSASIDLSRSPTWEAALDQLRTTADPETISATEFCMDSPLIKAAPQLNTYAGPSFTPARPLMSAINDLMQRIYNDFEFKPGFTDTSTPLSEVLEHRRGVCQDFAQLAIGCLRSMGFPARYVSGYIETLPHRAKKNSRALTLRMPGFPHSFPAMAGSTSIPPTTRFRRINISPWHTVAIFPT